MAQTKAKLNIEPVEDLPDSRPGPKDSEAVRVYRAAIDSPTGVVQVSGDPGEVKKFYLSMVQWRRRQREAQSLATPLTVRKAGDRVFVSVRPEDSQPTRSAPVAKSNQRGKR